MNSAAHTALDDLSAMEQSLISRERERVLFWTVVVSFFSLLPSAYGAYISNSTALLADLLRSTGEFIAIFLSWCVIVQVTKSDASAYNYGIGKLEQLASLLVAATLFVSFAVIFGTGIMRLLNPQPLHNPYFGLLYAALGTLGNGFVWWKDYQLNQRSPSPVIEAQWKLFRAKTLATTIVVVTVGFSLLSSNETVELYLDPIGSLVLALFLLHSSYSMVSTSMPDLIDKSVDEKVQLIIFSTLHNHKHHYTSLEKVRSRRSGSKMFIDIFLSFEAETPFKEVHECVMAIKFELKQRLGKAEVIVIPSLVGKKEE